MYGLFLILAAVPNLGGPSQEAQDEAAKNIAASSVFGSAFIVMLGVLLAILAYMLYWIRSENKSHKKERDELLKAEKQERDDQDARHSKEREEQDKRHLEAMIEETKKHAKERNEDKEAFTKERTEWDTRHATSMTLLGMKDKTIGEIQEKRVELAQDTIGVAKDSQHKIDRLIELLGDALSGGGSDDSEQGN